MSTTPSSDVRSTHRVGNFLCLLPKQQDSHGFLGPATYWMLFQTFKGDVIYYTSPLNVAGPKYNENLIAWATKNKITNQMIHLNDRKHEILCYYIVIKVI